MKILIKNMIPDVRFQEKSLSWVHLALFLFHLEMKVIPLGMNLRLWLSTGS